MRINENRASQSRLMSGRSRKSGTSRVSIASQRESHFVNSGSRTQLRADPVISLPEPSPGKLPLISSGRGEKESSKQSKEGIENTRGKLNIS